MGCVFRERADLFEGGPFKSCCVGGWRLICLSTSFQLHFCVQDLIMIAAEPFIFFLSARCACFFFFLPWAIDPCTYFFRYFPSYHNCLQLSSTACLSILYCSDWYLLVFWCVHLHPVTKTLLSVIWSSLQVTVTEKKRIGHASVNDC